MDQLVSKDIFIIILLPSLFLVAIMITIIIDRDITRAGVFFAGFVLIGVAGYVAYYLMIWEPIAEKLVENKESSKAISKKSFEEFKRTAAFVLWIIPFVTGSLGTNLISDALTKPLEYKNPSTSWLPLQFLKCLASKAFWLTLWSLAIFFEVMQCIFAADKWPRRWRLSAKTYRRNYLRKYAVKKQPWEN